MVVYYGEDTGWLPEDERMPTKAKTRPKRFNNGFLDGLDGRCAYVKRLRRQHRKIVADLGGAESLSVVQMELVGKFCWLSMICNSLEKQMATASEDERGELNGRWTQAVNALSGLASKLGIERKMKNTPWAKQL